MDDFDKGGTDFTWSLGRWPIVSRWAILVGLSLILTVALELARMPAALLLAPMIAGIVLSGLEADLKVPQLAFTLASSVVGCLMARSLPASIFVELVKDWPIYALGIGSVIAVAAGLGILLTKLRVFPGTTAIWGSAPGAATAMVLMADAFGADARLVAFMAYLRVALVALVASLVARFATTGGAAPPPPDWFAPIAPLPFLLTLALVACGYLVARFMRVPAGSMMVPMVLGVLLHDLAGASLELPPLLLACCYAIVGWAIGLRFTRPILAHAARALPAAMASMISLIAICGLFAMALVWFAGVDPLTAYLATSPGGADSVAIIAANTPVDVPFVMAMQAGRFIVVLLTGPALARWIATRSWLK